MPPMLQVSGLSGFGVGIFDCKISIASPKSFAELKVNLKFTSEFWTIVGPPKPLEMTVKVQIIFAPI